MFEDGENYSFLMRTKRAKKKKSSTFQKYKLLKLEKSKQQFAEGAEHFNTGIVEACHDEQII